MDTEQQIIDSLADAIKSAAKGENEWVIAHIQAAMDTLGLVTLDTDENAVLAARRAKNGRARVSAEDAG